MQVIKENIHKQTLNHATIAWLVWDESWDKNELISSLKGHQLKRYNSFSREKRKSEFLYSRLLLNTVFPEIDYEEPKEGPLVAINSHLSLTHSGNMVAVMHSKTMRVGIDLELVNEKILRIKHKFCSERESRIFPKMEDLILLWSTKESVFKRLYDEHLPFLDIQISINENGLLAEINREEHPNIEVHYKQIGDYFLTYSAT